MLPNEDNFMCYVKTTARSINRVISFFFQFSLKGGDTWITLRILKGKWQGRSFLTCTVVRSYV